MTHDEVILKNLLRLADHHREHCDGATCNVSLSFLLEVLQRAGIEVPADQRSRFI
jgi:hypothetical protein